MTGCRLWLGALVLATVCGSSIVAGSADRKPRPFNEPTDISCDDSDCPDFFVPPDTSFPIAPLAGARLWMRLPHWSVDPSELQGVKRALGRIHVWLRVRLTGPVMIPAGSARE